MNSDQRWADALSEAESPERRQAGLWARCYAEADGVESRAKAAYVKALLAGGATPEVKPDWPTSSPPPAVARPKGMNRLWWIVIIPAGLFVALMVIGALAPKNPEMDLQRAVIEKCQQDIQDPLTPSSSKEAMRQICSGIKRDFVQKYGREP